MHKFRFICSLVAIGLMPMLALAESAYSPLQIHGFISQALVVSKGNDIAGNSTSGSVRFREIGLNASYRINADLMFAGQVVSARTGAEGSDKPELDFASLDWRIAETEHNSFGLKVGRLRIPLGLKGDTRDIAGVRPGIFMPDSVYYSSRGAREILFSGEGLQGYWGNAADQHDIMLSVQWMRPHQRVSNSAEQTAFGDDIPGHFEYRYGRSARLHYEIPGKGFKASLTHLDIGLEHTGFLLGDVSLAQTILSFSQASGPMEYVVEFARRDLDSTSMAINGVAAYVEARYRATSQWQAFVRYEEQWSELGDRSGEQFSQQTGLPKEFGFTREIVLGGVTFLSKGLSLSTELHYVDGLAGLDRSSNPAVFFPLGSGDLSLAKRYWHHASVQLAYRF